MILDEATAYIDADNEDLLQKALAKLSEGKTVLVIAHRLSSIKEADSIVVLEQGKVIDCGTHDELINRCSRIRICGRPLNNPINGKWECKRMIAMIRKFLDLAGERKSSFILRGCFRR